MFKIPIELLELSTNIVYLSVGSTQMKKETISKMSKSSSMKEFLQKKGIDLQELAYMLKLVCKNLSANDWKEFLDLIKIGDNSNPKILKSLVCIFSTYDNNVERNKESLKINYNHSREMRSFLFEDLNLSIDYMEFAYLIKRGSINSLTYYL